MTRDIFHLVAALAPIVSWTLVAPASQAPTSPTAVSPPTSPQYEAAPPPTPLVVTTVTESLVAAGPSPTETEQVNRPDREPDVHPWRRLLKRETTPGVVAQANAIIRVHHTIGQEVPFTVGGERFLARIEEHYHPPGGDKFPWGPHPGVSVFVARPPATP